MSQTRRAALLTARGSAGISMWPGARQACSVAHGHDTCRLNKRRGDPGRAPHAPGPFADRVGGLRAPAHAPQRGRTRYPRRPSLAPASRAQPARTSARPNLYHARAPRERGTGTVIPTRRAWGRAVSRHRGPALSGARLTALARHSGRGETSRVRTRHKERGARVWTHERTSSTGEAHFGRQQSNLHAESGHEFAPRL